MEGYRTRRIALPGGKTIEILYRDGSAADGAPPAPETAPSAPGLHLCPDCAGELVYPVTWEERDRERWRIERRCPSCEWRGAGEYEQAEVERFDEFLTAGTTALLTAMRDYSRTNMQEDVERLIAAISTGLIEPIDF